MSEIRTEMIKTVAESFITEMKALGCNESDIIAVVDQLLKDFAK